jgi:hypothetical protein
MLTTTISDRWTGGLDASSPRALDYLQEHDRIFRRHVERAFGKFFYLWTVEQGEQNDRWHRHYLWRWKSAAWRGRRGWLPRKVLIALQDFAKSAGLGRVDWQPISDNNMAARYVAKYVTKTQHAALEAPAERDPECVCHPGIDCICGAPTGSKRAKRFRRFGSNEHYEEPHAEGWQFLNMPVAFVNRWLGMPTDPECDLVISLVLDSP